jgi:hypothetical protein
MSRSLWIIVSVLALLGACSKGSPVAPPRTPVSHDVLPAPLIDAPRTISALCEHTEGSGVCPSELPRTDGRYRAREIHLSSAYHVLDIASGGPFPGITRKNAPPRFAHLVIKAGDLGHGFAFAFPSHGVVSTTEDLTDRRSGALVIGTPTWGERSGMLVLAPPFPAGGIDGDHLIFRWTAGDTDLAVSLHVWPPLAESEATLRSVVESIP